MDELFQLVHSLSVSEQRYFRLQARQHTGDSSQKYLHLFDALLGMEQYDAGVLRQKCAGQKFLDHLPSARRYLFNQLTKSLRNYHSQRSVERRLRTLLDEVELLFERKLLRNSAKRLRKALAMAREHELSLQLLDCLRWERRLIKARMEPGLEAKISAIEAEEDKIIGQIRQEHRYLMAHDREFLKMTPMENLPPPTSTDSFYSHLAYQSHQILVSRRQGDSHRAWTAARATLLLYRSQPSRIEASPKRFINALQNYIAACLRANRSQSILHDLNEMQQIQGLSAASLALIEPELVYLEMLYRLNQNQYDSVAPLKDRMYVLVSQQSTHPNVLAFRYNLAMTEFLLGDFRTSKQGMEDLIQKSVLKLSPGIYHLARTWQLLLAILLGQDSLLTYYTRSARRFYRNRSDQPPFTAEAIGLAYRWAKLNRNERIVEVDQYQKILEEMKAMGKGELLEWCRRVREQLSS